MWEHNGWNGGKIIIVGTAFFFIYHESVNLDILLIIQWRVPRYREGERGWKEVERWTEVKWGYFVLFKIFLNRNTDPGGHTGPTSVPWDCFHRNHQQQQQSLSWESEQLHILCKSGLPQFYNKLSSPVSVFYSDLILCVNNLRDFMPLLIYLSAVTSANILLTLWGSLFFFLTETIPLRC